MYDVSVRARQCLVWIITRGMLAVPILTGGGIISSHLRSHKSPGLRGSKCYTKSINWTRARVVFTAAYWLCMLTVLCARESRRGSVVPASCIRTSSVRIHRTSCFTDSANARCLRTRRARSGRESCGRVWRSCESNWRRRSAPGNGLNMTR